MGKTALSDCECFAKLKACSTLQSMQRFSLFSHTLSHSLHGSMRCWSQRSLVTQNIRLHMLDSSMESLGSHWNPRVNCKPHSVILSYLPPFLLLPPPFGDDCSCFALAFAEAFALAFARARALAFASFSVGSFTCFGKKGLHQGLLIIEGVEKVKGFDRLWGIDLPLNKFYKFIGFNHFQSNETPASSFTRALPGSHLKRKRISTPAEEGWVQYINSFYWKHTLFGLLWK